MRGRAIDWIARLQQGVRWLQLAWQRRQERRQLRCVDLSDLGLSRADIDREANKPWWRE